MESSTRVSHGEQVDSLEAPLAAENFGASEPEVPSVVALSEYDSTAAGNVLAESHLEPSVSHSNGPWLRERWKYEGRFTYTLRWACTGKLIGHFAVKNDQHVADLCEQLDEGLSEEYGPPPVVSLPGHVLLYENIQLQRSKRFSEYAIPQNATIHVFLKKIYFDETGAKGPLIYMD